MIGCLQRIPVGIAQHDSGVRHFEQRVDGVAVSADAIAGRECTRLGIAGARSHRMRCDRLPGPVVGQAIDHDRRRQVVDPQIVALRQRKRIHLAAQEQAGAVVERGSHRPGSRDDALFLHLEQQMLEFAHIQKPEQGNQQQDARRQKQFQAQPDAKTRAATPGVCREISARHASGNRDCKRFGSNRKRHRAW